MSKEGERVRIRFENIYGEGITKLFLKYIKSGLRPYEIIVLLKLEMSAKAVRYWIKRFK